MHRKHPRWLVLVLAPLALAMTCGPALPKIEFPGSGSVITTPSFVLQVTIPAGTLFDPAQDVTINGTPVVVSGGPTVFTATINPGAPLLDDNLVQASVTDAAGNTKTRGRGFQYAPPKARLRRITDPADLISGPLAHGQLGDWLLENDHARYIIQDVGQRDMYSVGAFGGNLIDAELKANPGNDHFLETQPMLNLETVINAQTFDEVNDGQDGLAAVLRTCGPDDLLDFVNPSTSIREFGFTPPPLTDDLDLEIDGCTEYRLEPGSAHLEMTTEVMNNNPPGGFPGSVPPIPEDLPLLVGDWLNPGGQLDTRATDEPGWGDGSNANFTSLSFLGVDQADGVEYGWMGVPDPAFSQVTGNYFVQSGVFVVLHNAAAVPSLVGIPPLFVVPQGGSLSYTRVFTVGDGTGAAALQLEADLQGVAVGTVEGCVTVGGTPRQGSRVTFGQTDAGGAFTQVDQSIETVAGPCPNYSASVPAGTHDAVAGRLGAPYETNAAAPPTQAVSVTAGATTSGVDFALPATGQLQVTVTDHASAKLPARVTVVGFDPSPEIIHPGNFLGFPPGDLGLLHDVDDDLPFGVVAFDYTDKDGTVTFDVEPGSYQVFVSRGTEYSLFQAPVTVAAGAPTAVAAQIAPVLDTAGFVSSDFHVHGIRSADSRVPDLRRVLQFAGEGVENVIMTDHHVHTDLVPAITAAGLGSWVTSTVGEEITTFDYGHFNGYPFSVDATKPSGGSTDWGQAAPPGMDFPSHGALNATPAAIFTLGTTGAQSLPDTTLQVNHIDSHYAPLKIDTSVAGAIQDGLTTAAERDDLRLPPTGNLFFHFPALELWNGMTRGHQSEFLDDRIGIWFNQLNKGLRTTAISDTDTHTYTNLRTAGARTWTAASTDAPASILPGEVAQSVDAGRAVGGQGIYMQARLLATDGSAGIADLTLGGSTDLTVTNNAVDLEIRVQAPLWAAFDRIEIYANGGTLPVNPAEPYLYTADPATAQVLSEGDCDPNTTGDGDFDFTQVVVQAGVPGASRLDATITVNFTGLTQDTWFVVVAKGTDGSCAPMFPVFASNLDSASNTTLADLLDGNVGESGVMPLGVTNALYADVDGVAGFQPPNP